ncbi:hypothetical protein NL676_008044 [Syzygium grande]|nr:hypothetical protein NL676_008044 [Syzygium grande]
METRATEIVSRPTEKIVGIMDKDIVKEKIIIKEDTSDPMEVIMEILDKDRIGGEIRCEAWATDSFGTDRGLVVGLFNVGSFECRLF